MNPILVSLKQYPVAIVCAIVLLTCGAVSFLRGGLVDELSIREAELVARIQTVNRNIKEAKNLEENTLLMEGYVSSIKERIFLIEEHSVNINFFYSLEEDLDIVIAEVKQLSSLDSSFDKGAPNELRLYSAITYSITVNGTFHDIVQFCYKISQLDSLMRIADFQLENAGASLDGQLEARLRVLVLSSVVK